MKIFDVKTTILGIVFIVGSFAYIILPFLYDYLWESSDFIFVIGLISGILLILVPDKFVEYLISFINSKINKNLKK